VVLTASTPIVDVSGPQEKVYKSRVPARSVVIPATRTKTYPAGTYSVPCALIIGQRRESTDKKTTLNAALRELDVQV
jgi:2,3,4,5-tetrahydropyridine-2-carboxylate N-succinyltransferase